jgi:hypothetical protein
MPLSLHSAATLPFSPSLIQSQRLFLKFISALSCVMQMVAKEVFSLWPQVPARNPNRKSPGSASIVNGGDGDGARQHKKNGAQRPSQPRTTLTGADEPYNGQCDSRHDGSHHPASLTSELLITSTLA